MNFFVDLFDFILHIDQHLTAFIAQHGLWTYALCFAIVFVETGLVIAPLLPGDSLLFAAGALAAAGGLDVHLLAALLIGAAILGDSLNYACGKVTGPRVFRLERSRLFNVEYLDRTRGFFERHGAKTVVLARFLPILRTFAPFVAGIGAMPYRRFLAYNVLGGMLWVSLFLYGGYFFGNLPAVRSNFSLVIVAIILLSLAPAGLQVLSATLARRRT